MLTKYNPAIDGLRAIAVTIVIIDHYGFGILPGGFVGVDVFFVISGYLITSIIRNEIQNNTFSFNVFYKKRIIRLAPAFYSVAIITALFSILLLLPAELIKFANSSFFASTFLSNFYMWKEVGGYFGTSAQTVPFLHLWSLAVEEQYYLLWPLVLVISTKYVRQIFFLIILIFTLTVTIYLSQFGAVHFKSAAYYLLPTRVFELLAGAVISYIPIFYSKKYSNILGPLGILMGLCIIFVTAFSYSDATLFPGYNALIVVLGSAMTIYFSSVSQQGYAYKFLTNRSMTYIGKVSYPWYLVHWPIIVLVNAATYKINNQLAILCIVVSFVSAHIIYKYVEIPSRALRNISSLSLYTMMLIVPIALSGAFATTVKTKNGFPDRFPESLISRSDAISSHPDLDRGSCNNAPSTRPTSHELCVLGDKDERVSFLLVGDSHANHFTPMIDIFAQDAGLRGYDITQDNTIYLPMVDHYFQTGNDAVKNSSFTERNNKITEIIQQGSFDAVVLAGSYAAHINESIFSQQGQSISSIDSFKKGFLKAIEIIESTGATVYVVGGNPYLQVTSYDCTLNRLKFNLDINCTEDRKYHNEYYANWYQFLDTLVDQHPNLQIIYPDKIICRESVCLTEIDNTPLYRDREHLNSLGSELLGKLYLQKYKNPFHTL